MGVLLGRSRKEMGEERKQGICQHLDWWN